MKVIHAGMLEDETLQGAEHGATISLILDESEPGQGPRLHRHPYDETWVIQQGNLTFQVGHDRHPRDPATLSSCLPVNPTNSSTKAPGAPSSSASTPTQPSSANGSNERCHPSHHLIQAERRAMARREL
jgi:hypothetical protein